MYSVSRVESGQPMGPSRTLDHVLLMAEASGPGRYEVSMAGDVPRHVCYVTLRDDGTFTLDPRQAGSLNAVLSGTLTRA